MVVDRLGKEGPSGGESGKNHGKPT